MNNIEHTVKRLKWITVFLLATAITGCGGKDTSLGSGGNPRLTSAAISTSSTSHTVTVVNTVTALH